MLERGLETLYRQALAASHEPYTRIEVWDQDTKIADDLVIFSGNVNATLGSEVSRVFEFTVAEDLYPAKDTDLLAPFGNEVRAYRGITFGDGSRYDWQVFRGKIDEVSLGESGMMEVHCEDRAADVLSNGFRVPTNSSSGILVPDQIRLIIDDALGDATFGTFDVYTERVPLLLWDHDRGSALSDLATAVGSFWYPLADGSFVLRRYPWTLPTAPILTMRDGEGGTVVNSSATRRRSTIYNQITVTAERLDGTTPITATAEDDNPASPTYVGGKFGVRNKVVQLNTPQNAEGAEAAARRLLQRVTGTTEAWSFWAPADAALELGDVLALDIRGRKGIIQVVQAISLPMDTRGIMSVTCRAQVIQQLQELV